MARHFTSASSQYMSQASSLITAVPMTIACWALRTSAIATILFTNGASASDNFWALEFGATGTVIAASQAAGAGVTATTTATLGTATWGHVCGVFTSATLRAAFLNGANKVTNATSNTPAGTINLSTIGCLNKNGAQAFFHNGDIMEVGLWSAALDDAEVAALAKGFAPPLIRPQSLVGYWPLFGNASPEPDRWRSRLDMTLTGTPTKVDHSRVYYRGGLSR